MLKKQQLSLVKKLSNFFILFGLLSLVVSFLPIIAVEIKFHLNQLRGIRYEIDSSTTKVLSDQFPTQTAISSTDPIEFSGDLLKIATPIKITPVDKNSLVIEKLNINTPIIFDVPPTDKNAYEEALKHGIAHAKGTPKPGEVGNSYLFAHSTLNPLEIERYSAVFTLLNKLEVGDRIISFIDRTRYDFSVTEKQIVPSFNTEPLLRNFDEPVLTLQTCYPPGIPLNRLIITAKLIGRYEI